MTVTSSVEFCLGVSMLWLIVSAIIARPMKMQKIWAAIGDCATILKRQYKTMAALVGLLLPTFAHGQTEHAGGGEANLTLPDLSSVNFEHFFGLNGHALLTWGLLFCVGGLLFGLAIYVQLKNLPVHRTMREMSELIYETCKTYLVTQGKFILLLWVFIAVIISLYFGVLAPVGNRCGYAADHFGVLAGRHRGQLRGGVVRNSRQHLCELADGIRRIARQTVSMFCDSAEGRHEHRHGADLGRAAHHAVYPSVRPGAIMRAPASSASRLANRWAPRPCVLPAASSPRSPTSAPT